MNDRNIISIKADVALAATDLYKPVTAAGVVAAGTDIVAGVVKEMSSNGSTLTVAAIGSIMKMIASASIAKGVKVYLATGGKIGTTDTNTYVGITLDSVSADTELVDVLFKG